MTQTHALILDKCPKDSALQYIVIRTRKKAYSVYLLHILKGVQAMQLLTKIPRNTLDFHGAGQPAGRDVDSLKKFLIENTRKELVLVTEIYKRQEARDLAIQKYKEKRTTIHA